MHCVACATWVATEFKWHNQYHNEPVIPSSGSTLTIVSSHTASEILEIGQAGKVPQSTLCYSMVQRQNPARLFYKQHPINKSALPRSALIQSRAI